MLELNKVIKLPNHDKSSCYNNYKQLDEHVKSMIVSHDGATFSSEKLQAIENIWTVVCGIANYKKLIAYNEKTNVKVWLYSFKNDDIITLYEK